MPAMNFFKRFSQTKYTVGLEMLSDGLAVVARGSTGDSPKVIVMDMLLNDVEGISIGEQLAQFIVKKGLSGADCNLTLAQKDYQLLLVEAPDVVETELRDAIRWRIKDLISVPVENAVVDVFLLPNDGTRGDKRMAYVAVAELKRVKELIEIVKEAKLNLKAIDIGELAMRNLSLLKEDGKSSGRGVGFARLTEGAGSVALFREGNLYLSRQFQINYGAGLLDDLPVDNLILELQRSLDYYERQMGQKSPAALYLCGNNVSEDKISMDLSRALSVPLKYADISNDIKFEELPESGLVNLCIGALGSSLRDQVRE